LGVSACWLQLGTRSTLTQLLLDLLVLLLLDLVLLRLLLFLLARTSQLRRSCFWLGRLAELLDSGHAVAAGFEVSVVVERGLRTLWERCFCNDPCSPRCCLKLVLV